MKEVALISSNTGKDGGYLGDLDAKRGWGNAKDYVEMQSLMLQQDDYVIATGVQYGVRDFADSVACKPGITIRWEGSGIDENGSDATSKFIVPIDTRNLRPVDELVKNRAT